MEKKKLLLVAVSVGIFLIIVIGLSILIFLPKTKDPTGASRVVSREEASRTAGVRSEPILPPPEEPDVGLTEPATVDAVGLLRNREDLGTLQPTPIPPPTPASPARTGSGNNGSSLVIEVPQPSSAAIPSSAGTASVAPAARTSPSSSQMINPAGQTASPQPAKTPPPTGAALVTAPSQSAGVSQSSYSPASAAPAPNAPTVTAPRPTISTRSRDNYWVQVGAFSTEIKAQDAQQALKDKGITAIILSRDIDGQNYFRVRIGPYTSQNEADYWVALIKNISGFENSQIWQNKSEL